ncbi:acyl-CoA synthetase [Nocardia higoensis]|uniref:Acyl-CoA synthetase n=1 Tax=Nocardia higoensis TaxID=228599 RepID=A0ABS0D3Y0_9NOCA|nr:acyl-CoA synthetase [Nocardia higoensis]MBF6353166.1 acyl-CoA synthetase [Nocardia higoensis]
MPDHEPTLARTIATARSQTVGDLLRRSAQRYPDRTAIADSGRRLTYREFDAVVNRVSHALLEQGIGKGTAVALLSRNSSQYAVLTLALAKVGAMLVPVNFMLGAEEIAYILRHCGARAFVVEHGLLEVATAAVDNGEHRPELLVRIGGGDGADDRWTAYETWEAHADDSEPEVLVGDDDPIRLMYTSGTESRPKGVLLSSKSLISQYVSAVVDGGMSGDDIEVHALPLYHCAQMDCFLLPDIYLGASSIILPGPDPATVLATIERERATKFFAPPTVWIALLQSPRFASTDLSSLTKGYYGASPMPVAVLEQIRTALPALSLWNFYGQTEMSPVATILRPHEQFDRAGSAGRAALHVETLIVDDDDNPLPPGELGEIVHRSPHATLGYLDDEAKTAEAFRNGWFHSGDLGIMSEDGYLSVVDRKKDMIKTGGENVASREVEEALYTVAGVAEAAVFGTPHPTWIEAVTAVVVAQDGHDLTEQHIIDGLRPRLAGFKLPKRIVFVEELPKNPSGKILKRELRQRFSDSVG